MSFWIFLLIVLEIATIVSLYLNFHFDEVTMLLYSILLVSIFILYKAIKSPGANTIKKLEDQVRRLLAENDELKEKLTDYETEEKDEEKGEQS